MAQAADAEIPGVFARSTGLTAYSPEVLTPLLNDVRSSNLKPGSKTFIHQLATDAVRMSDKIAKLEADLAKLKEQQGNKTVNQPSSKKP